MEKQIKVTPGQRIRYIASLLGEIILYLLAGFGVLLILDFFFGISWF